MAIMLDHRSTAVFIGRMFMSRAMEVLKETLIIGLKKWILAYRTPKIHLGNMPQICQPKITFSDKSAKYGYLVRHPHINVNCGVILIRL